MDMAVAVTVGVIVGLLLLLAFGRVSPAGGIMGATTSHWALVRSVG